MVIVDKYLGSSTATETRREGWVHPHPRGAYIHVPFCHRRCPYCNFTLVADRAHWIDRYLMAISKELSQLESPQAVETIFIGGGTPTLLDESQLERLLQSLHQWLPIEADGEWTIEANPKDLTERKCRLLRANGINRISLGGQSFNDQKLQWLGRDHHGQQLHESVAMAKQWFPQASVDLIFGVPDETCMDWERDLESILKCQIPHISTYGLTYEKGAIFWSQLRKGDLHATNEEDELAMYFAAIDRLTAAGMTHYEVSNFAFANHACRHNQLYWEAKPWWGFGPGAASFIDGIRRVNHRSTSTYLKRMESGTSPVAESEIIEWPQWTRERFVFGMRKLAGVDWEEMTREGDPTSLECIRPIVDRHLEQGWFIEEQNRVRLSRRGLAISDALWPAYL